MKIGVTERGDPSIDLTWAYKLENVDAAIIITKNVSQTVIDKAKPYFDKLKFHVTCTGYGGTVLEPNIPRAYDQLKNTNKLVSAGLPKSHVVVRIDPIIPTEKGVKRAEDVFHMFAGCGYKNFRVSVIDMYPHVRERFKKEGLPLPYGNSFAPVKEQLELVDAMLKRMKEIYPDITIESCAEGKLKETNAVGCVSLRDAEELGIDVSKLKAEGGYQRNGCLCCSYKTELLTKKEQCPYRCLYCYWR